jgi:hypothetical protein
MAEIIGNWEEANTEADDKRHALRRTFRPLLAGGEDARLHKELAEGNRPAYQQRKEEATQKIVRLMLNDAARRQGSLEMIKLRAA